MGFKVFSKRVAENFSKKQKSESEIKLEQEYEEVAKKKKTPEGKGKMLDIVKYNGDDYEVWQVKSYEAVRYLGGSFGSSVEDSKHQSAEGSDEKDFSYKHCGTKWTISTKRFGQDLWDINLFNGRSWLLMIKTEPTKKDKMAKLEIQFEEGDYLCVWDKNDQLVDVKEGNKIKKILEKANII